MVDTPDIIVKKVLTELATNDFEGIKAGEFWSFVESACGKLDEFTKTVVWNWLLEKPDFEVWRKSGRGEGGDTNGASSGAKKSADKLAMTQEKKDQLPDFQTFFDDPNINDYMIKVSEDYQSLYLTGVQQKDNILGKMPYDLLRIIAKHKEAGINSLDLIRESGQDKRSLTTRLAVLEDNMLITKFSISVKKCITNHMIHFRFAVKDTKTEDVAPEYYDRYQAMTQIIDALKKEDNKLRLTKDLFEEIKESQPILKLRWFNKILKFLVDNGFIEMVQVEFTSRQRYFPGVRYLKDLPPASNKSKLLEKIREQGLTDKLQQSENDIGGLEDTEETIDQPNFNRYFPLTSQIHSLVLKNPGIMNAKFDSELTGTYHTRQISNIVEGISTNIPNPANPDAIVGQIFQIGKTKFYRFTTQNILNRRDPNYKYVAPIEGEISSASDTTLFEESIKYGSSYTIDRRFKIICVPVTDHDDQQKYYLIPKGYNGALGSRLAASIPTRFVVQGEFESENGWIKVNTKTRDVVKDLVLYNETVKTGSEEVEEFNKKVKNFELKPGAESVENNDKTDKAEGLERNSNVFAAVDNTPHEQNISNERATSTNTNQLLMDYGPEFRRAKLRELTDENRCICINSEFCAKISRLMKVGYLIDRRTLIRDAMNLVAKNLVEAEKLENGKFVVKSIKNPPTEELINECIVDIVKTSSRKFTAQVQFQNLPVRNEGTLIRGWKFADKEMRLQNAMKSVKNSPTGRSRRKRVKIINNGIEEQSDEEAEDYEPKDASDAKNSAPGVARRPATSPKEDDILEPLMDDRKRKKFKVASKSQARVVKTFKKIRTSVKVTNDHVLILIKAIVITQSLSVGGNIDWPTVAKVLDDIYGVEMLRRQWPRHRKMLGQRNLMQAKKNWEAALLDAVSNGTVTSADLENYDIFKMLDIWKSQGADIFINKTENEILNNYEDNFKSQVFKPLKDESGQEVFRESTSMIEKEHVWTSRNFMYPVDRSEHLELMNECEHPTSLQVAKTKLKALFATKADKFNSGKVRHLFANIPKELYSQALTELENQKAIAFLGEDSKIKFTLTDRLMLTLDCKLDDDFANDAKRMCELFDEIDTSHNAILLSTRCPSGCYAPLFALLSNNNIVVTRVDQEMDSPNTYYTKSLDRGKLESDFLISHYQKEHVKFAKRIPVPLGAPCSLLWIDLEGDFNEKLWHKCVYVLIWSIVFHPGTPFDTLCARIEPLLEPFEVKRILDWLVLRGNVITGQFGGYWPTECWFDIK